MNPQSGIVLIPMNGLRGNPPLHMISDKKGECSHMDIPNMMNWIRPRFHHTSHLMQV